MEPPEKLTDLSARAQKYYRQVLFVLSVFILLFGAGLLWGKPIKLTEGQTTSWWEIANNVQSGKGYKSCNLSYVPNCLLTNQETAQREPLPIYLFAWVGSKTNNSIVAFQSIQILAALLTMFGIFRLAREIYNIESAVIAAFAWVVYLPALRLQYNLTGDLLGSLFVSFGFIQFIQIIKYNKLKDWISFGVLFGLAALSRFATLALVFGLGCGYLLFLYKNDQQKQPVPEKFLAKSLLSMLVFSAIFSPWVIRNWIVFKQPVISSSLVGYNLYRHNAIVAKDVSPHYVGPDEAYAQVQALIVQRPEIMTPLNEAQLSTLFKNEAVKLIKAHPLKYALLTVYRFIPLWFNIGVLEEYGSSMKLWDYAIALQQLLLLILFIFGLQKKDWMMHPIALGIAIYLVTFLLVEAQLRYAVPIMSGVIAVASQGLGFILHYVYDHSKNRIFSKKSHL
jgi:Dolichyl-phosphate-mannose-protein mannosyltransferase